MKSLLEQRYPTFLAPGFMEEFSSMDWGGEVVWGRLKHIIFTVYCISVITSAPPQILRHYILECWGPLKSICLHPTGSSWFSVDMEGLQALVRGLHGAQLSLVTASNQHTAFLKDTAQPLGVFDLRPLKWELLLSLHPLSSCRGPP